MPESLDQLLPGVPLVESPFFDSIVQQKGFDEPTLRIARELRDKGYAVFDFPDSAIPELAERIRGRYGLSAWSPQWKSRRDGSLRMIDGWRHDEDIRRIATNPKVAELLSAVYGRRAFPFQTLLFPVGTQQRPHSDSAHFSSYPARFMCGVWVALEDTDMDNGPLVYYPGSQRWPVYTNEHLGVPPADETGAYANYAKYETLWQTLAEQSGAKLERFFAKKGQALIWTANVLHGGDVQRDPARTRYSQVTHYFFEGCSYYTPLLSEPFGGKIFFREPDNIITGAKVTNQVPAGKVPLDFLKFASPSATAVAPPRPQSIPEDFDGDGYLRLNPDVARAGVDPVSHYLEFGYREGRMWRS